MRTFIPPQNQGKRNAPENRYKMIPRFTESTGEVIDKRIVIIKNCYPTEGSNNKIPNFS